MSVFLSLKLLSWRLTLFLISDLSRDKTSLMDIWQLNGQNQWLVNGAKEQMGHRCSSNSKLFQVPFELMATEKFWMDSWCQLFERHRKNFQAFEWWAKNFGQVMPAVQMANQINWLDDASHANGWQKILYGCCEPLEQLTNNFKWVTSGIWTAKETFVTWFQAFEQPEKRDNCSKQVLIKGSISG